MNETEVHSTHPLSNDVQGRYEELVTDQGQGVKHVDDADDVENHSTAFQLFRRKKVRRKIVPFWFWFVCSRSLRYCTRSCNIGGQQPPAPSRCHIVISRLNLAGFLKSCFRSRPFPYSFIQLAIPGQRTAF